MFSLTSLLSKIDWLAEVQKGTSLAESLGPLLVKTAMDGFAAAEGGGSLLTVLEDATADIEKVASLVASNNVDVAPAPAAQ